jgi:ABC-type transporter Mla subunit MlaD
VSAACIEADCGLACAHTACPPPLQELNQQREAQISQLEQEAGEAAEALSEQAQSISELRQQLQEEMAARDCEHQQAEEAVAALQQLAAVVQHLEERAAHFAAAAASEVSTRQQLAHDKAHLSKTLLGVQQQLAQVTREASEVRAQSDNYWNQIQKLNGITERAMASADRWAGVCAAAADLWCHIHSGSSLHGV